MCVYRLLHGGVLPGVLLIAVIVAEGSARAQSDAELKALNQRVIELYRAGKYGEAVPFAEHYNRREHLSSVPSQMWWKLTNGDRNSPPA